MICVPIAQQAEQAAVAADTHMIGQDENDFKGSCEDDKFCSSRRELTGAEIWTLAKTAIELIGRKQVHKFQHRFKCLH